MIRNKQWIKSFAQLLGITLVGAAFPLGFAPFSAWPVAVIAVLILWYALQSELGQRRPFLIGWCFGLGVYGLGTSWIFVSIYYFGGVSLNMSLGVTVAFTALLALTSGASTWLYRYLFPTKRTHPSARITDWPSKTSGNKRLLIPFFETLCFASSWLLLEWFRTWFFSGFPWLFLGYAGLDSVFSGYIPIVGVLGTSWIMVAVITLPASAFYHRARPFIAISASAGLTLVAFGLSLHSWTLPKVDQSLAVHLIQGNIPQSQKRDPYYFEEHLDIYKKLTVKLWDKLVAESPDRPEPHLVIWPEAAIPNLLHIAWDTYKDFDQRAQAANAGWISGVPWAEVTPDDYVFHNGIIAAGIGSGFYEKQRLVPFGESLPFPTIARKLGPLFNLSEYGFSPGEPNQAPLTAQGLQISPFICYEVVFPELVRQQAQAADIMLTISNDGWFGRSFGPDQHFQMARARALETGKMLIRVTNNGITALINEKGIVIKQLPTFERGILSGAAYPTEGQTPFMSLGHFPALLISLFTACFSLMARNPLLVHE